MPCIPVGCRPNTRMGHKVSCCTMPTLVLFGCIGSLVQYITCMVTGTLIYEPDKIYGANWAWFCIQHQVSINRSNFEVYFCFPFMFEFFLERSKD